MKFVFPFNLQSYNETSKVQTSGIEINRAAMSRYNSWFGSEYTHPNRAAILFCQASYHRVIFFTVVTSAWLREQKQN